ncbi:MAG TPA: V-type ATPase subunit [Rectinemataceae bacterium]|nr:V-type ATPase subunit [Rectinemataceae bacterium]
MAASFRPQYTYARVLGSVARFRLGSRAAQLAKGGRVAEVWKSLFDETAPQLPERLLVSAAERRLEEEAQRDFISLGGLLSRHEDFFKALLRKAEYGYAKRLVVALQAGEPAAPSSVELPIRSSLQVQAWPDRGQMFQGRRFGWLAEGDRHDPVLEKNRLDRQYYSELGRAASRLPAEIKGSLPRVLRREVELENIVWALRLRRYYGLGAEEIRPFLIVLAGADATSAAMDALGRHPDSKGDWSGWEFEDLVNESAKEGEEWHLDLKHVEVQVRRRIFADLLRFMHSETSSFVPLYAWYRIKEYEIASIFGVLEGIHLEAPVEEIAAFASQYTGARA